MRVASLTKAVTAVAALSLVDEGALGLDESVERWLPELADRRVLRRQDGPLDDTVPAERSITVRDLLAFTAGYGHDFSGDGPQTQIAEFARLGLGVGPPAPATMPTVDEWMARLSGIPLDHQPGAAWRYDTGSDIAGVLLARVSGEPLEDVLRARVLEPLGMVDTSFSVDTPAATGSPRATTPIPTPGSDACTTRWTGSGRRRRRSRRAAAGWCRPSTTSAPSGGCCSPAAEPPTAARCCRQHRSRR